MAVSTRNPAENARKLVTLLVAIKKTYTTVVWVPNRNKNTTPSHNLTLAGDMEIGVIGYADLREYEMKKSEGQHLADVNGANTDREYIR